LGAGGWGANQFGIPKGVTLPEIDCIIKRLITEKKKDKFGRKIRK